MTCWSRESIAICFNSNNYSSALKNKFHKATAAVSLEVAAKDSTAVYFLMISSIHYIQGQNIRGHLLQKFQITLKN